VYPPPACSALGTQCQEIPVTLRIGSLEKGAGSVDHEATWLLGHTERMSFRNLRLRDLELLVDAVLHVRCRHLKSNPDGNGGHCAAHGFAGPLPPRSRGAHQPRRLGGDKFLVVEEHRLAALDLPYPARSLPVIEPDPEEGANPCSIAPCTTADHTRGSACCRDLQVEILCAPGETALEALVRSRLSPYLCKVSRENDQALEAELISACGFLDDEGQNCTLHGRQRSDGRPAKPDLCSEWPDDGKGMHPGCIFYVPPVRRSARRQ
jgi:Fe-S-cluster containining protein